ncbi:hypothetical protein KP77_29450 [Jeotgalibacillus alimentarius]|uniref:DUF5107 domain-containing protein n=1 Tax=Jeotgalibacillus alimentarius TaxID=135826 RepID=A0A0C2VHP4_9BACL|nr:DUF5107 domain-containing protein [Jeotgalibacillus alimentarius]KIL43996.1 hypothetical protein KP77_29450 [Jeotgalibacillus alimentarius]
MREGEFKGLKALILENEALKAVILPDFGGKVASFYDKKADYEWFFQSSLDQLPMPHYGSAFGEYTPSGYDDMFPGIDEGPHPMNNRKVPDHGEVWSMVWDIEEKLDNGVTLQVASPVFPYILRKTITLLDDGLEFRYRAINTGEEPFAYIWAPHALLNMNEHTRIELPPECDEIISVEQHTDHLGPWGTYHPYPITTSEKTKEQLDLSRMEPPEAETVEKFYFAKKLESGWCRTVQEDLKRELYYSFDPDKIPYLAIWKTQGGYQGDYNFALEPCTGMYDDVYVANKIDRVAKIPSESEHIWVFTMTVKDYE